MTDTMTMAFECDECEVAWIHTGTKVLEFEASEWVEAAIAASDLGVRFEGTLCASCARGY